MRGTIALLLVATLLESCGMSVNVSFGSPTPTPVSTPSLLPSPSQPTPSPTPVPTPTPALVEAVECADVELFIASTHADRLAAAGISAAAPTPTPLPAFTRPPGGALLPQPASTPPPLGQYILTSSPVATYTKAGYAGYIYTFQDLGGDVTGQSPQLALRDGLQWGYDRTWTAASGAGGFQNFVYEFASAIGAVDFDEGAARGACLNGGTLFDVPGMPGAIGQRYPGGFPDYALRVSFLRGKRRYVVLLSTLEQVPADTIFQAARIAASVAR